MRAQRKDEANLRTRERLRFRVYAAVRDVVLGTELFRSNFQLHEPEVSVNVYTRFVDVNISLNEAQLHLIPADVRLRDLDRFAKELRNGLERIAPELQLEFTTDPNRWGGSEPVWLSDLPIGYRGVLVRTTPE